MSNPKTLAIFAAAVIGALPLVAGSSGALEQRAKGAK